MEWLSQPIVQFAGVIGVLAFLNSLGFDVSGMIRKYFVGDNAKEEIAALRNDFQSLLTGQDTLTHHFNHETTDGQDRVETLLATLHDKMDNHVRAHDRTNFLLEEIKTNGIRCRTH